MRNILKQSSLLFVTQALGRVIGFFYTIFLARNLGVEEFGLYTTALAYFSLVSVISDFGFSRFLIRELAKDQQRFSELIWSIGLLRLTFTTILFAIFSLGLFFLDPDKLRVHLVVLGILAVLPQSIALTLDAIFVALRKLQYSSISLLIFNLSTTILGSLLIFFGFGTVGALSALILGQLFYLISVIFLLKIYKIGKLKIFLKVNLRTLKTIIQGSYVYGILGIIGLISFKSDIIILSYIKGNFETGIYGAAYRFLEASIFIPSAFAVALFPILAKLQGQPKEQLKRVYLKSLQLMFLLGLATLLFYLFVLPILIKALLPSYLSSIKALQILALAIPFIFIHIPSNHVLLSNEEYLSKLLKIYLTLFLFNILMYFILISNFGFVGAAWGTVISEILTFISFYLFLQFKVFR